MTAFQKVYETYAKSVYRFLLSLCGSADLAEELLQETFYQAFLHIDRFEGRCSLYTWLCQIGKNAWLKECRRKKRFIDVPWEELSLREEAPNPEEQLLLGEEYKKIHEAIRKLKDPYGEIFILHAIGQVKLKEIAILYGKTESWARVTYFRAKQQILQEVSR